MQKNSSKPSKQKQNKPKNELTFDKETHTYFLGNKILPSVSEIMKPLTNGMYSKIPSYILDKAKKRGTGVHEAVENYILFDVISEEYQGYVEQFIRFMDKHGFKAHRTELMLSDGNYAGTIDLVLETNENELILVDTKTTNKIHYELIEVQLSGYKALLKKNGYNVKRCYVIQLKENDFVFEEITPNNKKWRELYNEYKNKVHEH